MVQQARALATRRRIIDSAILLFADMGYGETGLADILQHAGVSKGAFYYHFDSKEAVAAAIIEEFDQRLGEIVANRFNPATPRIEDIIDVTFAVQELMRFDTAIQIGHLLTQALGQVSDAGPRIYLGWTPVFLEMVTSVISSGELRPDVDATDLAEAIWTGTLGSHLVSAALGDDPFVRLARSWRVLLRSALPAQSIPEVDSLLAQMVDRYSEAAGIRANGLAASSS